MEQLTIREIEKKGYLLFKGLVGSQAYGMATPESDFDYCSIYAAPLDNLLGLNYIDQVSEDKNDVVAYELGKFMKLLQTANPTICQLLFLPDECILYKHPIMDKLFEIRDKFIVKKMQYTFGKYAESQIKKADSLGKKMNWEKSEMVRKNLLDFIFVPYKQGSQCILDFLNENGLKQEYCGLSSIPNFRFGYSLFYDYAQHLLREKPEYDTEEFWDIANLTSNRVGKHWYADFLERDECFKYKGIIQNLETSNDISLSSIPKNESPITNIYVNLDSYQQHCKAYREYLTWLNERNTQRYVDIDNHGQQIDGKNMSHCVRLLRMCKEISEGKGIIIKRPDAEYLKSIRKGKVDLKILLTECNEILSNSENLFENSNLPMVVDEEFVNNILIEMRKEFYQLK